MHQAVRLTKKAFTWGVVATTLMWSLGVAALPLSAKAVTLSAGTLIKGSLPAVYYYASNGKRYVFPNEKTYKTWYADFSGVQVISDADLATVSIGGNVTYRSGTRLVKIQSDPKTYAVEPGGKLRWVTSESVVSALWGSTWNQRIDDVSDAFFTNYASGTDLSTNAYPKGSLVKTAASPDVWYIDGTSKRKVLAAGMTGNKFMDKFIVTVAASMETWLSGLTAGTDISAGEPTLTDVAQLASGTTPTGPAGSGLTMAAASDNPAGATIVTDTVDGAQALIGMLKLRFTASADGAVQVNTVKISRAGISADADIQNSYLYDGDGFGKQLAKSNSVATSKITFSSSGGLFTVPAGGSKDVFVRLDLGTNVTSGKTISFTAAAADVTPSSSATTVSGSASGATFTVASVTDLGQLEMANVNPTAAGTVDPQDNYELWRFKFDANDQTLLVKSVKVTNAGSIGASDVQNFKIMDGATQLGATVATLSSNTATFDLSSMTGGGLKMTAGQTKQLSLRGDIKSGTNRTYRFSIRDSTDVQAYDTNYNVYTIPVKDAQETFAVIEPNSSGTAVDTTISTGKLTIQKASDSPSTNVPDGATNVLLAKFNFTAAGEDVKVTSLTANCSMTTTTDDLVNTKMIFDGAQVGTTDATANCDGAEDIAFTFGNSFVVPAGSTKALEVRADLTNSTIDANDTILINLEAGSSNAEGRVSLTSISSSASSGNTVTVKGGALVTSEDGSFTDRTASNPTGVLGAQGTNIGQFVVTGGGEDSDITQVVLTDDVAGTAHMASTFQNLKLWQGTTQIGSTVGTLTSTDNTTYTFTPSSPVRVTAGGTVVFKITADIQTGGTILTADGVIYPSKVSASGVTTGTDTSDSNGTNAELQNVHIVSNGNLAVYPDSAKPIAQTFVLGDTGKELARFKLEADVNEDINVTRIAVSDIITGGGDITASGTLKNLKLVDAQSGTQYGGTVASLDTTAATGSTIAPVAIFDNISNLTVPRSGSRIIKVVSDFTSYVDGGLSSSTHQLALMPNIHGQIGTVGASDSSSTATADRSITATGKDSGFSISGTWLDYNASSVNNVADVFVKASTMDIFRTKLTIAKASDSPSGLTSGASAQTVAKFVVTNSANAGNYTATLRLLNLDIGSTISPSQANTRAIKVYKDSVNVGNQLVSSNANPTGGVFGDTEFEANGGTFTDTDISAGSSLPIIVTMDTTDAAAQKTLTVGVDLLDILWSDGVTGTSGTAAILIVDSLPLSGSALSY
ncbi:hypothetical protein EPN90_00800 [Patescibacteria group bacterium]|nr:MAG: hypothetical protein EPN90_00800 [Patescibacteria group bacterium]